MIVAVVAASVAVDAAALLVDGVVAVAAVAVDAVLVAVVASFSLTTFSLEHHPCSRFNDNWSKFISMKMKRPQQLLSETKKTKEVSSPPFSFSLSACQVFI